MLEHEMSALILRSFPHTPTPHQRYVIDAIGRFLLSPVFPSAFILRGYAGTGKTSVIGAVVRAMQQLDHAVVLMAPTGRAAKVFSAASGARAYTIHKVIYRQETFRGEATPFSLGFNPLKRALFIVDEASMIGVGADGPGIFGSGCLLDDLVRFVREGDGCRLMLVGDTAQLPPVGEDRSPALEPRVLERYGMEVTMGQLTEVVRQQAQSGVLAGATDLRCRLSDGRFDLPQVCGSRDGEVRFLPGDELIEALVSAYADCGRRDTIVITRSNKRANVYNQGIRARIFDYEERLCRGDMVMAVRNNYYWTARAAAEEQQALAAEPDSAEARRQAAASPLLSGLFSFIANGDTAEVVRFRNVHEMHGFCFADATLRFPDYDDATLTCRVLLDTLTSEAPALTRDEQQRLYESVLTDYADVPNSRERFKRLREDPYYNALQIKYAYAVTCHKAQGGQWERVFVDQGYLTPEMVGAPYLRWLYTAFTRTTDRLYLVNWPEEQRLAADDGAEQTDAGGL